MTEHMTARFVWEKRRDEQRTERCPSCGCERATSSPVLVLKEATSQGKVVFGYGADMDGFLDAARADGWHVLTFVPVPNDGGLLVFLERGDGTP